MTDWTSGFDSLSSGMNSARRRREMAAAIDPSSGGLLGVFRSVADIPVNMLMAVPEGLVAAGKGLGGMFSKPESKAPSAPQPWRAPMKAQPYQTQAEPDFVLDYLNLR